MNAPEHPPQTALIVEDIADVSAWLSDLLETLFSGIAVHTAANLALARSLLGSGLKPDLALVDLGLPDGSGTDIIQELTAARFPCTIVVTTLFADDEHLFPALRAGAHGYLLKDQPQERTIAALQGILRGEPPLSPAIAHRLLRIFNAPAAVEQESVSLTPREREVLTLIAKGCRLPDLAARLGISRHTAADHVKNIYRKLDINTRAEATLKAVRLGFVQQTL
jgi:DNA-binding NarL/FixJ family response regulator